MTRATAERPWARLYGLQRWRNRAARQMKSEPLCRLCLAAGKVEPATVADHIDPHHGDLLKFWTGELQSLCAPCHSSAKAQIEGKGFVNDIGDDGWPTDPLHPSNRSTRR